jgi:hypothetical protein
MKKRIKIASIVVVAVAILVTIVNQLLWSQSYSYACWRVTHPFGPNVNAFGMVVRKTQPMHIPVLIAKVDDPDAWWIENMFSAWFPEAEPPKTKKMDYWNQWWKDHHLEHESSLILHHDPQF